MTVPSETVVRQAAALLLAYPDAGFFERLPLIRQAVAELKGRTGAPQLERFCDHAQSVPPLELGAHYVDTFDLKRRRTLHLTFYTDGDTRRRGHALSDIKQVYASRGWAPAAGELPDHLAVMLEFAARGDAELGVGLLNRFQPALELLSAALREHGTRYADVVGTERV